MTEIQIPTTAKELYPLIAQWGEDRNLIKGATMQAQFVKLMTEIREIGIAYRTENADEFQDGIGDVVVVLTILLHQAGFTPADLERAMGGRSLPFYHVEDQSNFDAVMFNLTDAVGELGEGIGKKNDTAILSGIGRGMDYMVMMADYHGFDYNVCVHGAYMTIKDRKGRMIDGTFVKEEDLTAMGLAV